MPLDHSENNHTPDWNTQNLQAFLSSDISDPVELQCALEYELARSTSEVVAACSDSKSPFNRFACYMKELAPEFPATPWENLPTDSKTRIMNPQHDWRTAPSLKPARIFDAKELVMVYLEECAEEETQSTVTLTSEANMDYRQRLLLEVDLNFSVPQIIDEIRQSLELMQARIEEARLAHYGSPEQRKVRKQYALPKFKWRSLKGGVAELAQLKHSLQAIDQVRRFLRTYKALKSSDERKTPARNMNNVLNQYAQFGYCWIAFKRHLRYRQFLGLDYNQFSAQRNLIEFRKLDTPLNKLINRVPTPGTKKFRNPFTPRETEKLLETILLPAPPER